MKHIGLFSGSQNKAQKSTGLIIDQSLCFLRMNRPKSALLSSGACWRLAYATASAPMGTRPAMAATIRQLAKPPPSIFQTVTA